MNRNTFIGTILSAIGVGMLTNKVKSESIQLSPLGIMPCHKVTDGWEFKEGYRVFIEGKFLSEDEDTGGFDVYNEKLYFKEGEILTIGLVDYMLLGYSWVKVVKKNKICNSSLS